MRRGSPWKGVNKCVICGSKLTFVESTVTDHKPEEGYRFCDQNHKIFRVFGHFDADETWRLNFHMPVS